LLPPPPPPTLLPYTTLFRSQITLSSAVTVLSTEDPVRVYQQFTTLVQLSHGRAELLAGRGSFTESFPLFGNDLGDYDELFEEKLDRKSTRLNSSHRTISYAV